MQRHHKSPTWSQEVTAVWLGAPGQVGYGYIWFLFPVFNNDLRSFQRRADWAVVVCFVVVTLIAEGGEETPMHLNNRLRVRSDLPEDFFGSQGISQLIQGPPTEAIDILSY